MVVFRPLVARVINCDDPSDVLVVHVDGQEVWRGTLATLFQHPGMPASWPTGHYHLRVVEPMGGASVTELVGEAYDALGRARPHSHTHTVGQLVRTEGGLTEPDGWA